MVICLVRSGWLTLASRSGEGVWLGVLLVDVGSFDWVRLSPHFAQDDKTLRLEKGVAGRAY